MRAPVTATRSRSAAALAGLALLATTACSSSAEDDGYGEVPARPSTSGTASASPSSSGPVSSSPAPRSTAVPDLAVEVVASGFEHGWDIGFLPDGQALVTERPGRIALVSGLREGATRTPVRADLGDLYVNSVPPCWWVWQVVNSRLDAKSGCTTIPIRPPSLLTYRSP